MSENQKMPPKPSELAAAAAKAPPPPPPRDMRANSIVDPLVRDQYLAELAEKAKAVQPKRYDITSKAERTPRVIHDHYGQPIRLDPQETKRGIWLRPDTAAYLNRGDLAVSTSIEMSIS